LICAKGDVLGKDSSELLPEVVYCPEDVELEEDEIGAEEVCLLSVTAHEEEDCVEFEFVYLRMRNELSLLVVSHNSATLVSRALFSQSGMNMLVAIRYRHPDNAPCASQGCASTDVCTL
jgi:hypothetical protein